MDRSWIHEVDLIESSLCLRYCHYLVEFWLNPKKAEFFFFFYYHCRHILPPFIHLTMARHGPSKGGRTTKGSLPQSASKKSASSNISFSKASLKKNSPRSQTKQSKSTSKASGSQKKTVVNPLTAAEAKTLQELQSRMTAVSEQRDESKPFKAHASHLLTITLSGSQA